MPAVLVIIGVIILGGIAGLVLTAEEESPVSEESQARVEDVASTVEVEDDEVEPETDDAREDEMDDVAAEEDSDSDSESMVTDYVDGTYTTTVSYRVPAGNLEPTTVELTIEGDAVVASAVEFDGVNGTSRLRQARFLNAYEAEVIGVDIDELDLAAVGGSSLTTGAFNEALDAIKVQAAS